MSNNIPTDTFGISTQYYPGAGGFQHSVGLFDLRRLARNLSKTGASRYMINLMCEGGFLLFPSSVYSGILGSDKADLISTRDIPRLIGAELKKYGVELFLCFSLDTDYFDGDAARAYGAVDGQVTPALVKKQAEIIRECSLNCKDSVSGWYIDSSKEVPDELLGLIADSCRAGNRSSLVSIRQGELDCVKKSCLFEDYTSGKCGDFTFVPDKGDIDGAQAHIIAPLGRSDDMSWGQTGLSRDAAYLYSYIKALDSAGCALTIDCKIYPDGTFDASQFNELCKLSEMLKKD